jgi:hypothetical protein
MQVWNPCFDVTPGRLVEGIITEEGVVPRDSGSGSHKVADFMAARQAASAAAANGTGEGSAATPVQHLEVLYTAVGCMLRSVLHVLSSYHAMQQLFRASQHVLVC